MKPRLSRKGKITQLSYDLPHRVHTAQVYPTTAPNGSTIIIYGHDSGVRVLWRGGRRPKQSSASTETQLTNGADDNAMIIDSDNGKTSTAGTDRSPDGVEYEVEEDEYDPEEPYAPIVQHFDLMLHTEVWHIAIPHMPPASVVRPANSVPSALGKRMVFAVTCSDCSIRVITLPLAPPSATSASKVKLNEHVITIPSQSGHQNIPNTVSATWTSREITPATEFEIDDEEDLDSELSRHPRAAARYQNHDWDLLIASHSNELDGLLRINRICVDNNGSLTSSPQTGHTLYLTSPASSISFNPSFHPSRRHSHLLVADQRGTARIYDPLSPSRSRPQSSRSSPNSHPKLGLWLASFNAPFATQAGSAPGTVYRKRILNASWALYGNVIITLLHDGEWGIWNLNARGPSLGSSRLAGASASTFVMRGFIGTASTSSLSNEQTPKSRNNRSSLAPMTPNTRKTKQESLFSGSASSTKDSPPTGGIWVGQGSEGKDESVLLWYNNEIHCINSLQAYWNRASSGGGSLTGPGIQRLEGLDIQGERLNGTQDITIDAMNKSSTTSIQADRLVVAEKRLVILSVGQRPDVEKAMALFRREEEQAMQEEGIKNAERNADQHLLAKGDLDVGGIDRLLDGMNGNVADGVPARKVGFAP